MMAAIDRRRTALAAPPELWLAMPREGAAPRRRARAPEQLLRNALLARMQSGGIAAAPGAGLTHSAGYVACATPAAGIVGIDLEWLWPRDVLRLARFAYSAGEAAWLAQQPAAQQGAAFIELWVLKEAAAKALAVPLLAALASCRFSVHDGRISTQLPQPGAWRARLYSPQPQLRLAWLEWRGQPADAGAATVEEVAEPCCREWLADTGQLRHAAWPCLAAGSGDSAAPPGE
jgi:hypothetical protein